MRRKQFSISDLIFGAFIVLIMWYFFFKVCPLMIIDTDDWHYINSYRLPVPEWGRNPTRVLPYLLGRLTCKISMIIFYPFMNFSLALSCGAALVLSVCISLYCILIKKYIENTFNIGNKAAFVVTSLVLIFHFLVMRTKKSGNLQMFSTIDFDCYFFYVIPNLICAIVVLLRIVKWHGCNLTQKSIYIILLYFGLTSNLFTSIIIVSYVLGNLLFNFWGEILHKTFRFILFVKKNVFDIFIMIFWIIINIFEMNGGRSGDFDTSLLDGINYVSSTLKKWPERVNGLFLGISIAILGFGVAIVIIKKHKESISRIAVFLISGIIYFTYIVLLCIKLDGYFSRPDCTFGIFFFFILILCVFLSEIIQRYPNIKIILPMTAIIGLCVIDTDSKTFAYSTKMGIDPATCIAVNEDIIQQIQEADASNKTETVIYVPKFDRDDNWPIAVSAKSYLPDLFYKYGIINNEIVITEIIPTEEKNMEFNIYIE
jgi:hypothetical protein